MTDRPHRNAWDRRVNETAKAWTAFQGYLSLGPQRTLPQVEALGYNADSVKRWSAQHDWRIRAAAHDDHMSMLYFRAAEAEAQDMGRRHVGVAQDALAAVQAELQHVRRLQASREAIYARLPADPADDDQQQRAQRRLADKRHLGGRDMAVLIKAAADLEHRVVVTEGAKGAELDAEMEHMTPDEMRAELARLTGVEETDLLERGL